MGLSGARKFWIFSKWPWWTYIKSQCKSWSNRVKDLNFSHGLDDIADQYGASSVCFWWWKINGYTLLEMTVEIEYYLVYDKFPPNIHDGSLLFCLIFDMIKMIWIPVMFGIKVDKAFLWSKKIACTAPMQGYGA